MSTNSITPQDGILDIDGIILQNGSPLVNKKQSLVIRESKILASSTIDTSLEPKVVGIDITSNAYDVTTGLIKAKPLSSLTSQEVLGVAVSSIPSSSFGTILMSGIITSTLTGVTVGSPVYATSSGTLSLSLSSRRIGYILTLGANAKVFVDIRTENKEYQQSQVSGVPLFSSGIVLAYPNSTAPSGWLLCNGASYLTATYPDLFSVIGYSYGGSGANFNVPDYRGMFLRGTGTHGSLQDAAGGNFSGPALHGNQLDMSQSHKHVDSGHVHGGNFLTEPTINAAQQFTVPWTSSSSTSPASAVIGTQTIDGLNGVPRIGSETRPVTYGIQYIIKV